MINPIIQAFHTMRLRPGDAWMQSSDEAVREIEANIMSGPAFALPSVQNPAILCGMVCRYGVGTVWMIVGENFADHWREILLTLRSMCASAVTGMKLRRLQMTVDANEPAHRRFARAVGFYQESVLPHVGLGPRGEDLLIFIWRKGN